MMKKLLLFVPFLALVACGDKGGTQQPVADHNATTATQQQPVQQPQPAAKSKTMAQYFEEFKTKNVPADNDLKVNAQTENFIHFNYSPKEGEIIGVTTVFLKKVVAEDGAEFIIHFMYGCAEGSCNLNVANLNVYSSNWEDVTTSMAMFAPTELEEMLSDEVDKLKKDKKSKGFDSFYATLNPSEEHIELWIVRADDPNLGTDASDPETRPFPGFAKLYWDRFKKHFSFDDPYAG